MVAMSRVNMQKTDSWSEQISYYRFWRNDQVSESGLTSLAVSHCMEHLQEVDHVLLIEDTTELNLEPHRHRITDKDGLGLTGNDKDLGFFCHPTIAVDASNGSLLGALDIHLWHRAIDKKDKKERQYNKLPIEEKESYRWLERAIASRKKLSSDQRVTVVQDREGDIYESLCGLKDSGLDFVIRSNHDRKIVNSISRIKGFLSGLSPGGEYVFEVAGNNKRRKRKAQMEIYYEKVCLCCPDKLINSDKYPSALEVYVVHAREKTESVPLGESPIEWTLYTSHEVNSTQEALQIVQYYMMRWIIEELFRTVKSEGVNYESSELESGKALRKLFIMALLAAIQILQLKQARSGESTQKCSLVFSEEQIKCLGNLLPRFEGKTEKLKNPFEKDNLAWAAWIIARLGGWKGYASQRPPGVITLHEGWIKFQNIFFGWKIAMNCV